ncbi:hypothetical protein ACNQ2O_00620 [Mycoplasma sp. AA7A]|uniref:hypothetical protein n=1 Tax=Mycoplasma sp. AA7A TaxID=3401665 RepID=UPI003AAAD0FA
MVQKEISFLSDLGINFQAFQESEFNTQKPFKIPKKLHSIMPSAGSEEIFTKTLFSVYNSCNALINNVINLLAIKLEYDAAKFIEAAGKERITLFKSAIFNEVNYRFTTQTTPELFNRLTIAPNNAQILGTPRDFYLAEQYLNPIAKKFLEDCEWDRLGVELGEAYNKAFDLSEKLETFKNETSKAVKFELDYCQTQANRIREMHATLLDDKSYDITGKAISRIEASRDNYIGMLETNYKRLKNNADTEAEFRINKIKEIQKATKDDVSKIVESAKTEIGQKIDNYSSQAKKELDNTIASKTQELAKIAKTKTEEFDTTIASKSQELTKTVQNKTEEFNNIISAKTQELNKIKEQQSHDFLPKIEFEKFKNKEFKHVSDKIDFTTKIVMDMDSDNKELNDFKEFKIDYDSTMKNLNNRIESVANQDYVYKREFNDLKEEVDRSAQKFQLEEVKKDLQTVKSEFNEWKNKPAGAAPKKDYLYEVQYGYMPVDIKDPRVGEVIPFRAFCKEEIILNATFVIEMMGIKIRFPLATGNCTEDFNIMDTSTCLMYMGRGVVVLGLTYSISCSPENNIFQFRVLELNGEALTGDNKEEFPELVKHILEEPDDSPDKPAFKLILQTISTEAS